jgi:hypothetical protein
MKHDPIFDKMIECGIMTLDHANPSVELIEHLNTISISQSNTAWKTGVLKLGNEQLKTRLR